MNKNRQSAVAANLAWFRNSGVYDLKWGVAERIAVTSGNEAIDKMKTSFPAWTQYDGYCVIEQRRADCNFQAALLFLLAGERETGIDLLDYLYFRSGMLFRKDTAPPVPEGAWQWSHIKQTPVPYFDDNAWCLLIQKIVARLFPELDRRYDLNAWADKLVPALEGVMARTFGAELPDNAKFWRDPEKIWFGNYYYPHFGALSCMALAAAGSKSPEIGRYAGHIEAHLGEWNASELSYAILGMSFAAVFLGGDKYRELAEALGERLLAKQDRVTGNFPSEHEAETPAGPDKVDTIYTVNWALLALQCMAELTGDGRYVGAKEKLAGLLLAIQDQAPEPEFRGCWRGMYDLSAGSWGGGDRYEGGAGSIYTGWTNAPIGIGLLLEDRNQALFSLLK